MKDAHEFKEDHSLMDLKLAIGYIACIIGGGGGGYSYLRPFEETKILVAVCCATYFLLLGVLTYLAYYEGGRVFTGKKTDSASNQAGTLSFLSLRHFTDSK